LIHETGFLTGARTRRIFWQSWRPESPARGSVVIVHGASEHSDRYQHVAAALNGDGYAVHAADHRGHGRSEGPRALIDRLDYAVADLDQIVLRAREAEPAKPLFMFAHSMGATVALRYAAAHQPDDSRAVQSGEAGSRAGGSRERLDGLILSGPLAALEAAPAPMRLAGRVLSAVAPTLPLVAIDASLVSRDPEVVRAYRSDPLVHHGRLPARTVAELATAIDSFPATVHAITVPTLIMYGTADRLCPPAGSQMLGDRIGAADKTVKPYPGLYHEIVNEPERDKVLADLLTWISDRVATSAVAGSSTT
jgi:alpha-beta hydrolase superfamily lysophospholipase